jgi:hypothetical protein
MLNDEATIGLISKFKLKYKSLYLLRNIWLNQVIVALRNLVKTPLYIKKYLVKPMWEDMFNIEKTQQSKNHLNTLQEIELDMEQNSNKFEEIIEKLATNILVQNILSPDQIMNDEDINIVALGQDYKPFELFQYQNTK